MRSNASKPFPHVPEVPDAKFGSVRLCNPIYTPSLALVTICPIFLDVANCLLDFLYRGLVASILASIVTASFC